MSATEYEAIIGLETHCQLNTKSKIFCPCPTNFDSPPNTNVCPICLGYPGVLPVLNQEVLASAVKLGLAIDGKITPHSKFDRKQYFYPDLPKNYQISQYDLPIVEQGQLEIEIVDKKTKEVSRKIIGITRLHMEEDAGKLVHAGSESLRCDVNISVRKKGAKKFGTKVEIKNMNSFSAIQKAIEYEIDRQIEAIENGGAIVQETRLWEEASQRTISMRKKEGSSDYRYFPEPDLPPLEVSPEQLKAWAEELPELPARKRRRYEEEFGLSAYDARVLTDDRTVAEYFETAVIAGANAKLVANWISQDIAAYLNNNKLTITEIALQASDLAELVKLIETGTISGKIAKEILPELLTQGGSPKTLVEKKGLIQISDTSAIEKLIEEIIAAHPSELEKFRAGKTNLKGFFVGQVMKKSGGKADPKLTSQILDQKLSG